MLHSVVCIVLLNIYKYLLKTNTYLYKVEIE